MTGETAERRFNRFVSGQEYTESQIVEIIEQAGEQSVRIKKLTFGYFRKSVAVFVNDSRETKVAKIALHPVAASLLDNEFAGRQAAGWKNQLPPVRIDEGVSVLISEWVQGSPAGKTSYFASVDPPFSGSRVNLSGNDLTGPLIEIAARSGQDQRIRSIERLLGNAPDLSIPVSPSHGDFVYWNCLRTKNGLFAVDYEAFSDARIAGYDLSYWYLLPAARRAVAFGHPVMASKTIVSLMPLLWRLLLGQDPALREIDWGRRQPHTLVFGYMLLDHAIRLASEEQTPETEEFLGNASLEQRRAVRAMYDMIVEKMLGQI